MKVTAISPDYDGCFDSLFYWHSILPSVKKKRLLQEANLLEAINLISFYIANRSGFMLQFLNDISISCSGTVITGKSKDEFNKISLIINSHIIELKEILRSTNPKEMDLTLQKNEETLEFLLKTHYDLFCQTCKQYFVEMYVGSARQSIQNDKLHERKYNTGLCFEEYALFCKKTDWHFNESVLCGDGYTPDDNKSSILNKHLKDLESRHPNAEIELHFYDDREDFFKRDTITSGIYCGLVLPAGRKVQVNLTQYSAWVGFKKIATINSENLAQFTHSYRPSSAINQLKMCGFTASMAGCKKPKPELKQDPDMPREGMEAVLE